MAGDDTGADCAPTPLLLLCSFRPAAGLLPSEGHVARSRVSDRCSMHHPKQLERRDSDARTRGCRLDSNPGSCEVLAGESGLLEPDRLWASIPGTDDDRSGQLVMPPLLLRIEGDPDEAQPKRNCGDEVAKVATN